MSRTKKMVLQIVVLLVLMGITFYLLLRDRNLSMVWDSVRSAQKGYILLAAASMMLYIFCGGWCIRVLLHGLGQSMSIWRCFKYSFVEFYFSALTPSSTGGQPMQLVYMKQDGYRLSDSTVLILIVTALYKLAFLLLALVFFLANWPMMKGMLVQMRILFALGLALNVLLIVALCFLLFSKKLVFRICTGAMHLLGKLRLVKHPERQVLSLARKSIQYRRCAQFMRTHPLVVLRTFGVLTLQRLALLVVPYLVYRAFGLRQYGVGTLIAVQLLLSRGISFYFMVLLSGLVLCGIQLSHIVRRPQRADSGGGDFAMIGYYNYSVILTYVGLGSAMVGMMEAMQKNLRVAVLCLMICGFCDMFDGAIARTCKRTEDEKTFGIQIDSLCDLVCFGVFRL